MQRALLFLQQRDAKASACLEVVPTINVQLSLITAAASTRQGVLRLERCSLHLTMFPFGFRGRLHMLCCDTGWRGACCGAYWVGTRRCCCQMRQAAGGTGTQSSDHVASRWL